MTRENPSTMAPPRTALCLALLLLLLAGAALLPSRARGAVVWLCHPGLAPATDPCETPLDTTVLSSSGASTVATPTRPPEARRPVDCFYVYPTVSNQLSINATKAKDPEVVAVAKFQASRFSPECRMFAPMYREVTVAGVVGNGLPGAVGLAFSDVLEAWRQYLADDNHGRGVVLIGHSQGSLMLRELIRTQIDPDPAVRRLLVGAVLLGGNVTVRAGATTGGDFGHVPVCIRRREFGCVVAYSTFSTDPFPFSFFGNTNTDLLRSGFGFQGGKGYQVACTDPGLLSGLSGPISLTVPTMPFPAGFIAGGIALTANGPIPSAPTTWVQGFQYSGACRTINGANVFRYQAIGGSRRLNEFPPGWGTHLVDFNLGVDRLTTIAHLQSQSWLRANFALGSARRDRRRGRAALTIHVPGAGLVTLSAPGSIRARRVAVSEPATVALSAVPTPAMRRRLARRRVVISLTVTYRPTGGSPIVRTRRVRLPR